MTVSQEELQDLFEAYCHDQLSAAQTNTLLSIVQNNDEHRKAFADYILWNSASIEAGSQMHSVSNGTESERFRIHEIVHAREQLEKSDQLKNSTHKSVRKPQRRTSRRNKRQIISWPSLVAAALLCAVGIVIFMPQADQAPVLLGVAADTKIKRNDAFIDYSEFMRLQKGDRIIGHATIQFMDGTTMELTDANCDLLQWEEKKYVYLNDGSITADVAKQQEALRIFSERSTAVVLGTTFTYSADNDFSLLEVQSGQVQLERQGKKTLLVTAGEKAAVAKGIEWNVYASDELFVTQKFASEAKIMPGSEWTLVEDKKALNGFALKTSDGYRKHERRFAQIDRENQPAVFEIFAEAGKDYVLWMSGCSTDSGRSGLFCDMVKLHVPNATWDFKGTKNWKRSFPKAPNHPEGHPIYNGWGDIFGLHNYGWIASADDTDNFVKGKPRNYTIRFNETGMQKIIVYPLEGPLRIDAIRLNQSIKSAE